ncbi:uncharacterized protein [Aquarana catesbeiana]|uniref:uncharacterized protein n=1 Tax=Aquarana catesbeiana TaxID=8400 RepID=UPI003CCA3A10
MVYSETEITFLDVSVKKQPDGSLSSQLYRKPTAGNSLLHAASFHPKPLLSSIPYTQYLRTRRNCSDDSTFKDEADKLRTRLLERGYSRSSLKKAYKRTLASSRQDLLDTPKQSSTDNTIRIITTYTTQHQQLKQILNRNPPQCEDGISITSSSENTIESVHIEVTDDEESYASSVHSEIDEDLNNLRVRLRSKYQIPGTEEPPAFPINPLKRKRIEENVADEEKDQSLIGHTRWCFCAQCRPMPTSEESKCCQGLEEVQPFLEHGLTCVTQHEEFVERCLTKRILVYQIQMESANVHKDYIRDANRCLRRGAYKSYTNMVHGFLGKNRRIPIPSCVVWAIRNKYPDPNEEYIGFKWSSDYNASDMAIEEN